MAIVERPQSAQDGQRLDYQAKLTGLLPRRQSGEVPVGTRRLKINLLTDTASGDNDGYADDIELLLSRD